MKKKRLKIKWGNVIKALIFVFCVAMILHDFYMLSIYSWVTGKLCSLTWFGVFTLGLAMVTAGAIYTDFEEQIEKASTTGNSQR